MRDATGAEAAKRSTAAPTGSHAKSGALASFSCRRLANRNDSVAKSPEHCRSEIHESQRSDSKPLARVKSR